MHWFAVMHWGSPPPMRGKVEWVSENMDDLGITPAYAGKRKRQAETEVLQPDHPRLCGEKQVILILV